MRKFVNDTLIVVPVFLKEQDNDLVEKIEKLTEVGTVFLIPQGHYLDFVRLNTNIVIHYIKNPVGIWGALEIAFYDITDMMDRNRNYLFFDAQLPKFVVLNLAPKLFGRENVAKIVNAVKSVRWFKPRLDGEVKHVVGMRSNIAASLGSDKRALLECFFTTLAGIILGHGKSFSCDGFSGLQSMTIERYIQSDWRWIESQRGKEPWGGALISQIQSFQMKSICFPVLINTEENRTWPSTLGDTEKKAVLNMLEKCRRLPIFAEVSLINIGRALDQFTEDFHFQKWLDPTTAKEEVLEMLRLGGWEE